MNVALIFGIALRSGAITTARGDFGRDFMLALLGACATLLLASDGRIDRWEGGLLLLAFALWLGAQLRTAWRHRAASPDLRLADGQPGPWLRLCPGAFGLAALIAAGRLFAPGVGAIATALGVDSHAIGIGALVGGNLFNGLAIVGVATSVHAAAVPAVDVALTLGFGVALLLPLPNRAGIIAGERAFLLLAPYGGFVIAILTLAR